MILKLEGTLSDILKVREIGLTFSSQSELVLYGYADASYLTHSDTKFHCEIWYLNE